MAYNNYKYNNKVNTGYKRYEPTMLGKIAMAITAPSALISFVAVIVAFFNVPQAFLITLVTLAIAFVGGLLIVADIVIFNFKNKSKDKEPKTKDIGRLVHLLVGLIAGIIVGYLAWGIR